MLRGRLFVTPTLTNVAVVASLCELNRLKDIEVKWLPEDQKERWSELRLIRGRAAFMWGSGEKHNESYPFTSDCGVAIKAIIDRHRDRKPCSFPTDRTDSEREIQRVHLENHMTATEHDGIVVVVQPERAWNPNRHLDTIEREINGALGHAAITLDCDGIPLFPALPLWVFEEGFGIEKVIRIIRNTSSKLLRFDIGGFVEGILKFDVIPRDELIAPTLEEVVMISSMYQRNTNGMSQPIDIRNRVCSKAFWIYVDAMDAFFSTE